MELIACTKDDLPKNVFPSNVAIDSGPLDVIACTRDGFPHERLLLATLQMTGEARHLFCKVIHCGTVIFLFKVIIVSLNSVHEVQLVFL